MDGSMIAKLSLPPWPDAAAPIVEGAKEQGRPRGNLGMRVEEAPMSM